MGKAGDAIGREIVEAAEAEIAKRYNQPAHYHWRRHPESVTADKKFTVPALADKTLVATACGRLVDYQQAVGDAEETDCRECAEVYFMVNPPPWVHSGV